MWFVLVTFQFLEPSLGAGYRSFCKKHKSDSHQSNPHPEQDRATYVSMWVGFLLYLLYIYHYILLYIYIILLLKYFY